MTNKIKVWSWRQAVLDSGLNSTTKLVLMVLSTYMNEHGSSCFPSQRIIAGKCSLSKRAVISNLNIAAKAGFIVKNKLGKAGKEWAHNEYTASYPSEFTLNERGEACSPLPPPRGEGGSPRGESNDTQGVKEVHTNSPKNTPLTLQEKKDNLKLFECLKKDLDS